MRVSNLGMSPGETCREAFRVRVRVSNFGEVEGKIPKLKSFKFKESEGETCRVRARVSFFGDLEGQNPYIGEFQI